MTVTLHSVVRDLCRETALSQPGKQEEEEEEEEEGEEEEKTILALCHVFPVLVSSSFSFVLMLFSPDPEIFSAFKPKCSNSFSPAIAMLPLFLN